MRSFMDNLCKGQWQLERWMKCDICVCMHRRKLLVVHTHIYTCVCILIVWVSAKLRLYFVELRTNF